MLDNSKQRKRMEEGIKDNEGKEEMYLKMEPWWDKDWLCKPLHR